jgi:hypothetical protein
MTRCPSSALPGTFSRKKLREKADGICLLPLLPTGEGARRADEGSRALHEDPS